MWSLGINVLLISLLGILGIDAWRCRSLARIITPKSLRLWYHRVEIRAATLRVRAGTHVAITCDATCVGTSDDPFLRWYGPSRHWIGNENQNKRISIERSISGQQQKLHFKNVKQRDRGYYYCRGWLGHRKGFDLKKVLLIVDPPRVETRAFRRASRISERINRPVKPKPAIITVEGRSGSEPASALEDTEDIVEEVADSVEDQPQTPQPAQQPPKEQGGTRSSTTVLAVEEVDDSDEDEPQTPQSAQQSSQEQEPPETDVAGDTPEANVVAEEADDTEEEKTQLPSKEPEECESSLFRCNNGECVDQGSVCDSFPDCSDGSDELDCASKLCVENQILCSDGSNCIFPEHFCDGIGHCADESDERLDLCQKKSNGKTPG